MRKPLNAVSRWGRKAWLAIKAFEEALDYRYQDYAQERFAELEQRVASLEKRAAPKARKPH